MTVSRFFAGMVCAVFVLAGLGFADVKAAEQEAATGEELLDEGKHKITFTPFHLSLLKGSRVRASVDIQLVLQLHDNKDYESLNALKPQLRADIAAALSTLARQRWRVTRPIDPDIVSAYLTPFIEHRVGAGKLNVYVLHALIIPK